MTRPPGTSRIAIVFATAALAALSLAACSSQEKAAPSATSGSVQAADAGLKDGFGSRATNRNVYFLTYYNPASDAFWNQMLTGAKDAAKLGNLKLTHQTTDGTNPAQMTDLINAAIATKPAALFIPFNDPAWEGAACEADKAGIAVFAFNVPPAGTVNGPPSPGPGGGRRRVRRPGMVPVHTFLRRIASHSLVISREAFATDPCSDHPHSR